MSGRLTHAAVALFVAGSLIVSPLYAQDQQAPAPSAQTPVQQQMPPPAYRRRSRRQARRLRQPAG